MVRASRGAPWFVRILVGCCGLALWSTVALAQKTDIITLDNGDSITCEIKELERGRLRCKTDTMGTVYIEWDHIATINTDKMLEIELDTGRRYLGSLKPGETAGEMNVTIGRASTPVPTAAVAFVRPIGATFWGRLDGDIDFGASFTQADNQLDYSLNATSKYTGQSNTFTVSLSSLIKRRDESTTTNRQVFSGQWIRQLRWSRWFGLAVVNLEHNEELDLEVRASGGYGFGRYLKQTNRWTWRTYATGLYSREEFVGQPTGNNNVEAGLGTDVEVFTFGEHVTDISTRFVVLPSLSDFGRVRLQFDAKVKREFVRDLYFSVEVFETYDSNPPQESAKKNDFGFTMSLGWSY